MDGREEDWRRKREDLSRLEVLCFRRVGACAEVYRRKRNLATSHCCMFVLVAVGGSRHLG